MERVYQRKRVDALAWRALLSARRKRWLSGTAVLPREDGEKPVRVALQTPRKRLV